MTIYKKMKKGEKVMLLFIVVFSILAPYYAEGIKNRFPVILGLSTVLSVAALLLKNMELPINSGELGMALLILVMFQGAFKKGSNLSRKLLIVRKEYSILGFVFILPHALLYMFGDMQYLEWNGILSFVIMIPLFITSFMVIRKKMKPKHWKALHLASYPAYALMFAHVIYVADFSNQLVYSIIGLAYMFLKIKNSQFSKLNKSSYKKIAIGFMLILLVVNVYSYNDDSFISKGAEEANETAIAMGDIAFSDGVYYGEAPGFKNKTVKVNVSVVDDTIADIEIKNYGATDPHGGMDFKAAVDQVKETILNSQSTEVDVVSGATKSTKGLINAVNNALTDASFSEGN